MPKTDTPNETLDRLVAEHVMGWYEADLVCWWRTPEGEDIEFSDFTPSTDLNHCHRALLRWGKITKNVHDFKLELGKILVPDDPHLISEWAIATADARTRCIAMLTALGVDLENTDA